MMNFYVGFRMYRVGRILGYIGLYLRLCVGVWLFESVRSTITLLWGAAVRT